MAEPRKARVIADVGMPGRRFLDGDYGPGANWNSVGPSFPEHSFTDDPPAATIGPALTGTSLVLQDNGTAFIANRFHVGRNYPNTPRAGESWSVMLAVACTNAPAGGLNLLVRFLDSDRALIGTQTLIAFPTVETDRWNIIAGDFEVPSGAVPAYVLVQLELPAGYGTAYLDFCSVGPSVCFEHALTEVTPGLDEIGVVNESLDGEMEVALYGTWRTLQITTSSERRSILERFIEWRRYTGAGYRFDVFPGDGIPDHLIGDLFNGFIDYMAPARSFRWPNITNGCGFPIQLNARQVRRPKIEEQNSPTPA